MSVEKILSNPRVSRAISKNEDLLRVKAGQCLLQREERNH